MPVCARVRVDTYARCPTSLAVVILTAQVGSVRVDLPPANGSHARRSAELDPFDTPMPRGAIDTETTVSALQPSLRGGSNLFL